MPRRDRDIFAAEYVLGTLPPAERERAATLLEEDQAFAHAVSEWERRLGPLAEAAPPLQPPKELWRRIEVASGLARGARASAPSDPGHQIALLKQRVAAWRLAAVGAAAAAAVAFVLWLGNAGAPLAPPTSGARYVAMLRGTEGQTAFLVTVEPEMERLVIRAMVPGPPPSKSYELWLMRKDGSTPATLGLVPAGEFMTMPVPGRLKDWDLSSGAQLAISLEPRGGAPEGRSMGKIVFAGELVRQTP